LVSCKTLPDKIKFICDATWRIGKIASEFDGLCSVPKGNFLLDKEEKETLLKMLELSQQFLKLLECMKNQTCFPASQFPVAREGLNGEHFY
jgi:hypothetical protein